MYSLTKQLGKFYKEYSYCSEEIKLLNFNKKKNYLLSTGHLNFIWQLWSVYWRTFWLTHLLGGTNLFGQTIGGRWAGITENEAIYQIRHLLTPMGMFARNTGSIRGSYQEITWGDIRLISNVSQVMYQIGLTTLSDRVDSALNAIGTTPKHFQHVRNCAVHLNKDTMEVIKNSVVPNYVISTVSYPTEILLAKDFNSGRLAIDSWKEDLIAFIELSNI